MYRWSGGWGSYVTIAGMRRPMTSYLLLLLASCGAHISADQPAQDGAAAVDAAVTGDASGDGAAFGPWSAPATVKGAATTADEDDVTLSSNALEMIFAVAGTTGKDLYYTSRPAIGGAWTQIGKLPFDGDTTSEESPRFSGDDLTLYFATDRGMSGTLDIWSVTRATTGTNVWGKPQPVNGVNTGAVEKWLAPCGTNRYVMVRDSTATGTDLYEGTFGGGDPAPIDALNTASNETGAFLTQDCLTLYFASNRKPRTQIYVSQRKAIGQPWTPAQPVDDFKITGSDDQQDPWLSADGHSFAFASDAGGTNDIYLSTR